MEKKQRGGKRPGAGRPKGKPHTVISFRVKTEWATEIKKTIDKWLNDLESRE